MARKTAAQVRAGKRLGRASKHCKGKKGRAFNSCRKTYLRTH